MADRRSLATGVLARSCRDEPAWPPGGPGPASPGAGCRSTAGPRRAERPRGEVPERRRVEAQVAVVATREPFTPAAGAKDLKSVLFNWTWHMGMLRSGDESELDQDARLPRCGGHDPGGRSALHADEVSRPGQLPGPGYRTQIECTRPNKQNYSNVETMSGEYAWDEDIPGAELVPGKGKATPRPAALEERLIRLWASPHGAPKAAIAGAAGLPPSESFGAEPGHTARSPGSRRREGDDDAVVAGGKGRRHISDPGSAWGDCDGHARCRLPAGTRRGDARDEQDGVRLRQVRRTGTIPCSRSRLCTPAPSSSVGTAQSFAT